MKSLNDSLASDPTYALYDHDGKIVINAEMLKDLIASQIYSFSFDKEMGDLGPARDETREIDLYYKEREWRLVPSRLNVVSGVATVQAETSFIFYKFHREDVNMIVRPTRSLFGYIFGGVASRIEKRTPLKLTASAKPFGGMRASRMSRPRRLHNNSG